MKFSIRAILIFNYVLIVSFAVGRLAAGLHDERYFTELSVSDVQLLGALAVFPAVITWFVGTLYNIDTGGRRPKSVLFFQLAIPPFIAFLDTWVWIAVMSS